MPRRGLDRAAVVEAAAALADEVGLEHLPLHAPEAAGCLPPEAAVRRLVTVILAGLHPAH